MVKHLQSFLTAEETSNLLEEAQQLRLRNSPSFLGRFGYRQYKYPERLPETFEAVAERLQSLVPNQRFNVAFVQRYDKGSRVLSHRDPLNNVGYTIIALFGEYEGAVNEFGGVEFETVCGDVLIAPCTINGKQGPKHSVSTVTEGTRWALILNTIE